MAPEEEADGAVVARDEDEVEDEEASGGSAALRNGDECGVAYASGIAEAGTDEDAADNEDADAGGTR